LTKLHMDTLQKKARYSKAAMREAVESLPKQLDETYRDTLQRVNSQDDDDALLAKQVLAWVHLAYAYLSVRMVQQAVAKLRGDNPGRDDCLIDPELLVSVCAGLVVIDQESELIRLVHYTVEEYLERSFNAFYPDASRDVNYCCLRQALDSGQLSSWMQWWEQVKREEFWYELLEKGLKEDIEHHRQLHYSQVPFSGYALFHLEAHLQDEIRFRDKKKPINSHKQTTIRNTIISSPSRGLEVAYKVLLLEVNDELALKCAILFGATSDLFRIVNAPGFTASVDTLSRCLAFAAFRGTGEIVKLLLRANASVEPMYEYKVEPIERLSYFAKKNCLGFAIQGGDSSIAKELLDLHPELADSPMYASSEGHTWKHETGLDLISKITDSPTGKDSKEWAAWQTIKIELQKRAQTKRAIELDFVSRVGSS